MKNILLIFIAVTVIVLGYRFCSSPSGTVERTLSGENIICFGDSLTYGTGASSNNSYPVQLAKLIGKPVINVGVPGNTTEDGLARLEKDVLSKSPRLVFITLGGNDLRRGISKNTALANLKTIVERIEEKGALVIIGGIKVPILDRGFSSVYKQLAEETGVVLVENILDDIMGNSKLMSDQIHPNDAGYAIMAERFFAAAKPYL